MNFDYIRSFLLVADQRNLSAAAHILKVNQTTLGRQIRSLEKELGTTLILRSYRGILLTEEGVKFRELSLQLVALMDNGKQTIQKELKDERGALTLFTGPGNSQLIITHLSQFIDHYPYISLDLKYFSDSRNPIDGDTDTFLLPNGLKTENSNMIHEKVYDIRLGIYASPSYLEIHGVPKTIDDLVNHRLIFLEPDHFLKAVDNHNFFLDLISEEKRNTLHLLKVHNTPDLLSALISGVGIGVYWEGPNLVPTKSLINIFPDVCGPTISYFFSYRESLKNSGKIKAFLTFLRRIFREGNRS